MNILSSQQYFLTSRSSKKKKTHNIYVNTCIYIYNYFYLPSFLILLTNNFSKMITIYIYDNTMLFFEESSLVE